MMDGRLTMFDCVQERAIYELVRRSKLIQVEGKKIYIYLRKAKNNISRSNKNGHVS